MNINPVSIQNTATTAIDQAALQEIQAMWKMPAQHVAGVTKTATIINSKHGMLSGVPIVCKGDQCPYKDTCMIDIADRIVGSRCPQEIGALLARFSNLCRELEVGQEDFVDLGQVKELVDIEIMIMRCDNKMAIDADFIEKSVKDIAKNGRVLYENKISQAVELKLSLIEKHSKLLKDLNASRSSKKESNLNLDPSQTAAQLIQKAKELDIMLKNAPIEVIEGEYVDVEEEFVTVDEGAES